MSTLKARMPGNPTVRIRAARMSDLDALVELENRSFTSDRMSRRQWRRHLAVPTTLTSLDVADGVDLLPKCLGLRLEARTDNTAAQQLYLKRGYRSIGEVSDYYEDGAPALRLEKSLRSR